MNRLKWVRTPHYCLSEPSRIHGSELRRRYVAHAIGVGVIKHTVAVSPNVLYLDVCCRPNE